MENQSEKDIFGFKEPEYEWGVKYRTASGRLIEDWGYTIDPRLSVVDSDGEIDIDHEFLPVVAVGKRLKVTEHWEDI